MNIQFRTHNRSIQIGSFILLWIWLLQPTLSMAQNVQVIEAKIVDETSKKPLPYATIYANPNQGTISNQEGDFSIKVTSLDKLCISYVGYQTQVLKVSEIPAVVLLKPIAVRLNEITVPPLDLDEFLMQVLAKIKDDNIAHKKTTNSFFYRQITKTNAVCNEILEAFFNATSHISISNLELIAGRYASLPSDSTHKYIHFGNFFYNSQIRPVILSKLTIPQKDMIIQPIYKEYKKYYTVSYDILYDSNSASTIYKINFKPRREVTNPILSGNIFIESSTLELKRFDGEIINNIFTMTNYPNRNKERIKNNKTHFSINYKTIEGVSFVEYVTVDVQCTLKKIGNMDIHSVMYNAEIETSHKTKKIDKDSDLLDKIANQKYDSAFWEKNVIIKRSPLEMSATKIFEKNNLFGTYSLQK